MFRRPPRSTRTYTLFPYTSLFRSSLRHDTPARLAYRYRPAGLFQLFAGLFKVGVASIGAWHHQPRSEEHTSELQSLMRISYAVFCLKKKTQETKQQAHI